MRRQDKKIKEPAPKSSSSLKALITAAWTGNLAAIQTLLSRNPELAKQGDPQGDTALMLAIGNGHVECARALLPVSDATHKNALEASALDWAARNGDLASLQLLSTVVELSTSDRFGNTVLMQAIEYSRPSDSGALWGWLVPRSDVHAINEQGQTALMLAVARGEAQCVRRLLPLVQLSAKNAAGETALQTLLSQCQGPMSPYGQTDPYYDPSPDVWACIDLVASASSAEDRERAIAHARLGPHSRVPQCWAMQERQQMEDTVSLKDSRDRKMALAIEDAEGKLGQEGAKGQPPAPIQTQEPTSPEAVNVSVSRIASAMRKRL